jgi:hypothetical protein
LLHRNPENRFEVRLFSVGNLKQKNCFRSLRCERADFCMQPAVSRSFCPATSFGSTSGRVVLRCGAFPLFRLCVEEIHRIGDPA